ncbi:putative malate dehydrogenase 1B [Lingula anatina]|uniref:Malate dehydrogenase, cytoplasmic n=1 Tax=Lingula anatina TaxID=7574 RepID=A0A1S3J549_LINAN|nr:putative malate dehydrogenase 1B [Lingula anatina]|eukprot:XP_013405510.1 putative malate dehydrogenase 1B [Lingula anatina]
MAKIVLAGAANCPYFARCELLADTLADNLEDFKLHKIVVQPDKWQNWLESTCKERGFMHSSSPLVWRELVDRGGKGVLIGGANDFQEYAYGYYGIKSDFVSDDMKKIGEENLKVKIEVDKEEEEFRSRSRPLKVCITNASCDVCYHMISSIGQGDVFGKGTEISLHLLDTAENMEYLEGVQMEAIDLAHGLLRKVSVMTNPREAFMDCSAIIFLDDIVKSDEESKDDWYKRNADCFTNYGHVLDEVAKKNARVLVAGEGPVNFNTFILHQHITQIPRQNIVALSRMVENHAKAIISERLKVNSADVVDIIVWGNVGGTSYADMSLARTHNYDGAIWGPPFFSRSAVELVHDNKWLEKEFPEELAARGEMVGKALRKKPSLSKAAAVVSQLAHWWNGSPSGQMWSMGVASEGWYGVPEGLVFSFPTTMSPKGYWSVIQDIELSDETKDKIQTIVKELISEKEVIYPPPYVPPPTPPSDPTPLPPTPQVEEKKEEEVKTEGTKTGDSSKDTSESDTGTTSATDGEDNSVDPATGLANIMEDKVGEEREAVHDTAKDEAAEE